MARQHTDVSGRVFKCAKGGVVSDQIEALRQGLVCAHCDAVFVGTYSQARHFKYSGRIAYCSTVCRNAGKRKKMCTEVPSRGPCKGCGAMFKSRTAKQYCCMDCYISSDAFKATREKALENANKANAIRHPREKEGGYVGCLECGSEIYIAPASKKKYCSQICYRKYMAKRFDRWVANPEELALPQCYDEFMTQNELPCLIEGCDWIGKNLSLHANQAHGIKAQDLKRAAGFNLTTGLVSPELHERLVESNAGKGCIPFGPPDGNCKIQRYHSAEGSEHRKKARALAGNGPQRHCHGCGVVFTQRTPFGRAKYCNIECRDQSYAEDKRGDKKFPVRDKAGMFVRWEIQ